MLKTEIENEELTLAIAAYDVQQLRVSGNYFAECGGFSQCTAYRRGRQLLQDLAEGTRYDIVVLDEQLQDMDVTEFMESFYRLHLAVRPVILVLSCRAHLGICNRLLSHGAKYCIMKPYRMSALAQRIQILYKEETQGVRRLCTQLYAAWGIQLDEANCGYLTDAVTIAMESSQKLAIRKELLQTVSDLRGVSISAVDSGIRRLLDRAEELSLPDYVSFKRNAGLSLGRPTIGHLVYAIKHLALEGDKADKEGEYNVRIEQTDSKP